MQDIADHPSFSRPGLPSAEDVATAIIEAAIAGRARVRTERPRVHCITNSVAQAFTANALLSVGAVPSMTVTPEEVPAFVASADALLVNLGTLDATRKSAIEAAVGTAGERNTPWVLDPVFIDRVPSRASLAREMLCHKPAAIRLNAAEFAALSGGEASRDAVARFTREHDLVAGLTGSTDWISDGERHAALANGHPLMAQVTAMGCAASALVACFLAVELDPFLAVAGTLVNFAVAGEVAGRSSHGPGSFVPAFLDALHQLDAQTLRDVARVA